MESHKRTNRESPTFPSTPDAKQTAANGEDLTLREELNSRPTHQFCRTIKSFITEYRLISIPDPKDKTRITTVTSFFKSAIQGDKVAQEINTAMQHLTHALKAFDTKVLLLEKTRFGGSDSEYHISAAQAEHLQALQQDIVTARKTKENLPLTFLEKKSQLNERLNLLNQEIHTHLTKKMTEDVRVRVNRDAEVMALSVKKGSKDTELAQVTQKIDNACCHCCSPIFCRCCAPTKEIKKQSALQAEIKKIDDELQSLVKKRDPSPEEKDDELHRLEQKREAIKTELEDLIHEQPNAIQSADARVDMVETAYIMLNTQIEAEARLWYADLNKIDMIYALRLYVRFCQFCQIIQNTLSKYDANPSHQYSQQMLDKLYKRCIEYQSDIETNFTSLFWCSESKDMTLSDIHEKYTEQYPADQLKILTEEISSAHIDMVLVQEEGSKKIDLAGHMLLISSSFFQPRFCSTPPQRTVDAKYRSLAQSSSSFGKDSPPIATAGGYSSPFSLSTSVVTVRS